MNNQIKWLSTMISIFNSNIVHKYNWKYCSKVFEWTQNLFYECKGHWFWAVEIEIQINSFGNTSK